MSFDPEIRERRAHSATIGTNIATSGVLFRNPLIAVTGSMSRICATSVLTGRLTELRATHDWRPAVRMTPWTPATEGHMIVVEPNGNAQAWPVYDQPDLFLKLGNLLEEPVTAIFTPAILPVRGRARDPGPCDFPSSWRREVAPLRWAGQARPRSDSNAPPSSRCAATGCPPATRTAAAIT